MHTPAFLSSVTTVSYVPHDFSQDSSSLGVFIAQNNTCSLSPTLPYFISSLPCNNSWSHLSNKLLVYILLPQLLSCKNSSLDREKSPSLWNLWLIHVSMGLKYWDSEPFLGIDNKRKSFLSLPELSIWCSQYHVPFTWRSECSRREGFVKELVTMALKFWKLPGILLS